MDSLALRAVYFDEHPAVGQRATADRRSARAEGAAEDSAGDEARRAVQVALDRRDNGGWS